VIVVKMKTQDRHITNRSTISKFSITSSLSKNENRDKVAFKNKQNLHLADYSSSKHHINISQKQTKINKSPHKLHSLHRSYNKGVETTF